MKKPIVRIDSEKLMRYRSRQVRYDITYDIVTSDGRIIRIHASNQGRLFFA